MSMTAVIESMKREAFEKSLLPAPWDNLKEHRCSCGRLLGRFSGRAEVKCPKCGKMNVVGVEKI